MKTTLHILPILITSLLTGILIAFANRQSGVGAIETVLIFVLIAGGILTLFPWGADLAEEKGYPYWVGIVLPLFLNAFGLLLLALVPRRAGTNGRLPTKNRGKVSWGFYLKWVATGLISPVLVFPISWVLTVFVVDQFVGDTIRVRGQVHITEDYVGLYTLIPLFGIVIGILQYVVLRTRMSKAGWWILTTTVGWSLAWLGIAYRYRPVGDAEIPSSVGYFLVAGIVVGLLMGIGQWLILRTRVLHAGWWIPVSGICFGIAGVIFSDVPNLLVGLAAVTLPSIGTGILLWLLLDKFPRDAPQTSPGY